RRELHRGRALGAESSFVDRAVRVAFDLQELGRAVDILRVGDEPAPDGAVGADGVDFLGAGDAKVERALLRGGEVEPERIRTGNERHAGGAGGSELQELTTSDFRHRIGHPFYSREPPQAKNGANVLA